MNNWEVYKLLAHVRPPVSKVLATCPPLLTLSFSVSLLSATPPSPYYLIKPYQLLRPYSNLQYWVPNPTMMTFS
jgi:hypothetical protein